MLAIQITELVLTNKAKMEETFVTNRHMDMVGGGAAGGMWALPLR